MKRLHSLSLGLIVAFTICLQGDFAASQSLGAPAEPAVSVETAFDKQCDELLLKQFRKAHREIRVAIFEFTKKNVADALIERANSGVKVSVKVDAHEAEYQVTAELLGRMEQAKIKIERIKLPPNVKMHDKFAVVDGRYVMTGSYNWTKRASEDNWENLVAIESPAIAADFLAEWERIKSAR